MSKRSGEIMVIDDHIVLVRRPERVTRSLGVVGLVTAPLGAQTDLGRAEMR